MESVPNTRYVDAKMELLVASVTVVVVVLAAVYVLSNSKKRKYDIVGKHVLVR